MPIRTTRGRAAAYRAVWQWPLRSPARLVITVVGVIGVAVLVGAGAAAVNPGSNSGGLVASPAPTTVAVAPPPSVAYPSASAVTSATPVPTALPPVPALVPTTLPLSQAPAAALQVAGRWAAAWVRPPGGTTQQQWLDGLRATTTDEYLGVLTTVDPSNIPATTVTGQPAAVRVSPRSVQVDVPMDTLTLQVTVVVSGAGGWRVSDSNRA